MNFTSKNPLVNDTGGFVVVKLFCNTKAKKSYYDDALFKWHHAVFRASKGFYSYCKNEVFYDCTLCKQILLLLYTKLLLSGILLSCRSIIVQLYLLLPSDRYR